MNIQGYKDILCDLKMFIDVGCAVSQRLVGTIPEQRHHYFADTIFSKILCHAMSLYKITPKLGEEDRGGLWDLSSVCAISRCIIEVYDVLEYIVVNNISEDERKFRISVWEMHSMHRRLRILSCIKSEASDVKSMREREIYLRNQIISDEYYQKLGKREKEKIISGDAPAFLISQKERNLRNGINHEYHNSATMMLSQHVHTFPMSVEQLNFFKAGTEDAIRMTSSAIKYSLGFLARAIVRMVELFPHGKVELNPHQAIQFSIWCSIVEQGVDVSSKKKS